jgi:hypothetical protein
MTISVVDLIDRYKTKLTIRLAIISNIIVCIDPGSEHRESAEGSNRGAPRDHPVVRWL